MKRRVAYYGGTFDPVHIGHLDVAKGVIERFEIDEFNFVPAFHAPHKKRSKPTSAFHRFAMLALSIGRKMIVSTLEVESPKRPYTIETLERILAEGSDERVFFVIGADSWEEITTWKRWEEVLTIVDIVVVTRPGYEISTDHVTEVIKNRVVDIRGKESEIPADKSIYFTDVAYTDVSATKIRKSIRSGEADWKELVTDEVVGYVTKQRIY